MFNDGLMLFVEVCLLDELMLWEWVLLVCFCKLVLIYWLELVICEGCNC